MAISNTKTILVDLGGTFVHPQDELKFATKDSSISLRRLMLTSIWMDYECGKLNENQCFTQLASEYHVEVAELETTISNLRQTITYDKEMTSTFKKIKELGARIFLVSNISKEDYAACQNLWDTDFWSIFDGVFTSSALGVRKPNLRFYRHVLQATRAVPHLTFFVDDRPDNVLSALLFGMKGTFDTSGLYRTLTNFIGDPVERARIPSTARWKVSYKYSVRGNHGRKHGFTSDAGSSG
jgi:FMN phosphatase YigB (HAD superfamily)